MKLHFFLFIILTLVGLMSGHGLKNGTNLLISKNKIVVCQTAAKLIANWIVSHYNKKNMCYWRYCPKPILNPNEKSTILSKLSEANRNGKLTELVSRIHSKI